MAAEVYAGYAADGTPYAYSTPATACVGVDIYGTVYVGWSTSDGANGPADHDFNGPFAATGDSAKPISIVGLPGNRQCRFMAACSIWAYFLGNWSLMPETITFRNFRITGQASSGVLYFRNTGPPPADGVGFVVDSVVVDGKQIYSGLLSTAEANLDIKNSLFINCGMGCHIQGSGSGDRLRFLTIIGCGTGIDADNRAIGEIRNCACLHNGTDFLECGNAAQSGNNASTDGTAPGDSTVTTTLGAAKPWGLNVGSLYIDDYRILTSSTLYGVGVASSGVTTDCDGNTRADPPSIGWHEGTAEPFGLDWPAAANVLDTDSYTDFDGTTAGTYGATYADAADVRQNVDRGDGTLGTLDLPLEEDVELGVTYDNETKTGTYDPITAAAPATDLAITSTGDGTTWTVIATTTEANSAAYLYDHSDDSLVAVLDDSATTADLTEGQELYCKISAPEKELSARYPAASGVAVPALTGGGQVSTPTLTLTDLGDGTGFTVEVSGADSGTSNKVYYQPFDRSTGWTLGATITENGTATVGASANTSGYHVYAISDGAGACDAAITSVYYTMVTDTTGAPAHWLDQLRANVGSWLAGIQGMYDLVGDRIYFDWPQDAPSRPFIIFTISRQATGDYPAHVWGGELSIILYDPSPSMLDKLETKIIDDLGDRSESGGTAIIDTLTGSLVRCVHFDISDSSQDRPSFIGGEDDSHVVIERQMNFTVVLTRVED